MAISSIGYDATVGETEWPTVAARYGATEGGVTGVTDWDPTITPTGVQLGPGQAYGWGITDTETGPTDVITPQPANGTRFDAIVLRREGRGRRGSRCR